MDVNKLIYDAIGASFEVYNALGPGLLESIYEEALCYELTQRGIKVERQKPVPLVYKGVVLKEDLRLDILVDDQIIIELKSAESIKPIFFKQLRTYLRLTHKQFGYLVNFGESDMKKGILRVNV